MTKNEAIDHVVLWYAKPRSNKAEDLLRTALSTFWDQAFQQGRTHERDDDERDAARHARERHHD